MISKLCEYNRRTEFIIQVLCDFITVLDVDIDVKKQHKIMMDNSINPCELCGKKNNYLVKNTCCDSIKYCMPCLEECCKNKKRERPKCPNCMKVLKYEQNYIENPYIKPLEQTHTIVMAQNLNILNYMYKKFVCKNLASVGYYIGGMSENELKKSEKKQVIFSSYQMASEGLDIPTLNAEFLITPKTDVVQITGRILRAKHAFSNPIIYDFVDSHELFQRQWLKRKAYYKKQNFKIIGTNNQLFETNNHLFEINNIDYDSKNTKWKVIFDSTFKKEQQEEDQLNGKCLIKIKK
jgi:superfamily II DNA or RNA helicase